MNMCKLFRCVYGTFYFLTPVPRWLGGQYNWIKKQWVWKVNGKLMKYQSFSKNQSSFSEWSCLLVHPLYEYNWIGNKCWEKQYYICQTNLQHPPLKNSTVRSQPGYYVVTAPPPKKPKKPKKSRITCPKDFQAVGKKCYLFSSEKDTWQNAYHKCEDKNSQLAIFRKPGQDKKLKSYARNLRIYDDFWIGGRYDWNGMKWLWAKNGRKIIGPTPEKQVNWMCLMWNSNSPNYGGENCVVSQYYLCQANALNIPEKEAKKYKVEVRFQLYNNTDPMRNYV